MDNPDYVKVELTGDKEGDILGWIRDIADASCGEFTATKLYNAIAKGTHEMYYHFSNGEPTGIYVVTTADYVSHKTMVVIGAAGETGEGIPDSVSALEGLAKSKDCTEIDIIGRIGWEKLYRQHGWRVKYQTLVKYI